MAIALPLVITSKTAPETCSRSAVCVVLTQKKVPDHGRTVFSLPPARLFACNPARQGMRAGMGGFFLTVG